MNSGQAVSVEPAVRLQPRRGWRWPSMLELWRSRELLLHLAMRDLRVRYKQTSLGVVWAIIPPIITMIVFSVIFGQLARIETQNDAPYPIFVFSALLPWQLFATTLGQSSNSLVANRHLFTKVYFPRLLLPVAPMLVGLVDFCIAFSVLLGLMAWYGMAPTLATLSLPVWLLLALTASLAIGLWLSAVNALWRDVGHGVPFLIQMGFFLTPVIYPTTWIPERWQFLYALNPMVTVIEGFRWAVLPGESPPGADAWVSVAVVLVLLVGGVLFFSRVEKTFADVV